jgi:diaminohydroxyphosphoribosylaminopyrimidine deaminase / 5-amino-6-(5-phosphoribosylamino)uracil reductase
VHVTAKVACTLDGHIATQSGESQWITGEAARQDGHLLRGSHDGILVGLGTVLADDPRLTCRHGDGAHPRPIVFDSQLRIPARARLLHGPARAVVITCADNGGADLNADLVRLAPDPQGRVSPVVAMAALASLGMRRVLLEGGAAMHRSFLDEGLVDELVLYLAPKVLAGGRSWVGGAAVAALDQARELQLLDVARLGDDLRLRYTPKGRPGGPARISPPRTSG